jgi:hypothetical protein
MASALSEALRQAAELQRQTWKALERIYAALSYSEFPPEHVSEAVGQGVQEAALALGTEHERIKLFRVRKAIEQKRAVVVPEEDRCEFCGEPLGEADKNGVRECPECWSKFDRSGAEVRG